ncbi:MAG: FHA domain-containing protein, partial [Planctomycetota bacterium]
MSRGGFEIEVSWLHASLQVARRHAFFANRVQMGQGPHCQIQAPSPRGGPVAEVFVDGGRLYLLDRGAPGGIFVNGKKVQAPEPISGVDVVRLGVGGPMVRFQLKPPRSRAFIGAYPGPSAQPAPKPPPAAPKTGFTGTLVDAEVEGLEAIRAAAREKYGFAPAPAHAVQQAPPPQQAPRHTPPPQHTLPSRPTPAPLPPPPPAPYPTGGYAPAAPYPTGGGAPAPPAPYPAGGHAPAARKASESGRRLGARTGPVAAPPGMHAGQSGLERFWASTISHDVLRRNEPGLTYRPPEAPALPAADSVRATLVALPRAVAEPASEQAGVESDTFSFDDTLSNRKSGRAERISGVGDGAAASAKPSHATYSVLREIGRGGMGQILC